MLTRVMSVQHMDRHDSASTIRAIGACKDLRGVRLVMPGQSGTSRQLDSLLALKAVTLLDLALQKRREWVQIPLVITALPGLQDLAIGLHMQPDHINMVPTEADCAFVGEAFAEVAYLTRLVLRGAAAWWSRAGALLQGFAGAAIAGTDRVAASERLVQSALASSWRAHAPLQGSGHGAEMQSATLNGVDVEQAHFCDALAQCAQLQLVAFVECGRLGCQAIEALARLNALTELRITDAACRAVRALDCLPRLVRLSCMLGSVRTPCVRSARCALPLA